MSELQEIKASLDKLTEAVEELAREQAVSSATTQQRCEAHGKAIERLTVAWEGNGNPGAKQRIHDLERAEERRAELRGFARPIVQKLIWVAIILFFLASTGFNLNTMRIVDNLKTTSAAQK